MPGVALQLPAPGSMEGGSGGVSLTNAHQGQTGGPYGQAPLPVQQPRPGAGSVRV